MIRIVSLDILDLLPFPSGILFALKEKNEAGHDKISFYSYDAATNSIATVTRSAYLLTKFGPAYMKIAEKLNDHISCDTVKLYNGGLFLLYSSGETGLFDDKGNLLRTGEIRYQGAPARDGAADDKYVWSVVPERDMIVKYSVTQNRVMMRIGGGESPSFSSPSSLISDERYLYVCNPGSHKINRVDLSTFAVEDFKRFDEPVYQYIISEGREFVVLASGVYML